VIAKEIVQTNIFLIFLVFVISCGPTEVLVDVEEVNVDTELNTVINMPEPAVVDKSMNFQTPVTIPTPIGLEGMNEAVGSISIVSGELAKTVESFGDILKSIETPTAIPDIDINPPNEFITLQYLLLAGFIVQEDTMLKRDYEGLRNAYLGFIVLDGVEHSVEVFIFHDVLNDPSLASSITVDALLQGEYKTGFYENLAINCLSQNICDAVLTLVDEKYKLFKSQ